jgi:hypothetical protein
MTTTTTQCTPITPNPHTTLYTNKGSKTPTKTQLKKTQTFLHHVQKYLQTTPAQQDPTDPTRYTLQTQAGTLYLYLTPSYTNGPGTIFTRFQDPQHAKIQGIPCNPYSGKWNHHYFTPWTPQEAAQDFQTTLNKIL